MTFIVEIETSIGWAPFPWTFTNLADADAFAKQAAAKRNMPISMFRCPQVDLSRPCGHRS